MENHKTETGLVGQPRPVSGYPTVELTENEARNATPFYTGDEPGKLFVSTKRPEFFPVGKRFRFRNKLSFYGWTVERHERLDEVRTHVILHKPERLYRKMRQPGLGPRYKD